SPLLSRLVVSYASIALTCILITSIALMLKSQSREIAQINADAVTRLSLADRAATLIVEQSHLIGNQAMVDMRLADYMTRSAIGPLERYQVLLKLRQYKSASLSPDHLGVYNASTGEYFCDGLVVPGFADRYRAALARRAGGTYILYMPELIANTSISTPAPPRRTITFMYLNRYKADVDKSCFTVSIPQSSLVALARANYPAADGELFVVDGQGTILSHEDDRRFMEPAGDTPYLRAILDSGAAEGSFVETIDGAAHLVSYVRSAQFDWTFVSAQPYAQVSAELFHLRRLAFAIAAIMLAFALALIVYQSVRLYRPVADLVRHVDGRAGDGQAGGRGEELSYIGRMFDEVLGRSDLLQGELATARPILANSVYALLLAGRTDDIPDGADAMLDELQSWRGGSLRCALVRPDVRGLSIEDAMQVRLRLTRELDGCVARRAAITRHRALPADDVGAVLIAQYEDEGALRAALNQVLQELSALLAVDVCMAVGSRVGAIEEVHLSLAQARRAERHAYARGFARPLLADDLPEDAADGGQYPVELEKKLADCLTGHRPDGEVFDEIAAALSDMPVERARGAMDQLMRSVYKLNFEFLSLQEQAALAYPDDSRFRRLSDDVALLRRVAANVAGALRAQRADRGHAALDAALARIERDYADPNLTVDALADGVGLSANYLSRMFKAACGRSLHSHLTERRLEQAARLLEADDAPVSQLCEMVGITNANYFFTIFKKRYGVTPSEYRRARRGGE
ncbi:MAG: helix-turn-helix domain-containing protein, partial [Clostridiales bacterium]|nr:helix-turn-helix domain-containing protein [Clostridiales bacterium]